MKNFIKNLNSLEIYAVRFIKTSFNVTFLAYFLLLVQYYLHRCKAPLGEISIIYFRETLVYILACFVLSLSFGLLIDIVIKKSK